MSEITLRPQVCPSDAIQLWVGVGGITAEPDLRWELNGDAEDPIEIRPLESARPPELVSSGTSRVFTGVVRFEGLEPNRKYDVRCRRVGGGSQSIRVHTIPDEIPSELGEAFHLLLVSCFHVDEDKSGIAAARTRSIPGVSRVNATLFLGDQVYLDLPTLKNYDDDSAWLARRFERYYARNTMTREGFADILELAPGICSPDDHEYWNNFPHRSPIIQNSWTEAGRARWQTVAADLFRAFQQAGDVEAGRAAIFDVDPLSVFVADTRSDRDYDRKHVMTSEARRELADWVDRVNREDRFGMFVSGQSLFGEPVGRLRGRVADWELANYGDYGEIVATLAQLRNDAILVTGDVHWGRVLEARSTDHVFYEVISSPTSLVTTVGSDTASRFGSWFRGLFSGRRNPWPRHHDADEPPEYFAREELRPLRYRTRRLHAQKGNHVTTLSFKQAGDRLEVQPIYMPIHRDRRGDSARAPVFSLHRRPQRVPLSIV